MIRNIHNALIKTWTKHGVKSMYYESERERKREIEKSSKEIQQQQKWLEPQFLFTMLNSKGE